MENLHPADDEYRAAVRQDFHFTLWFGGYSRAAGWSWAGDINFNDALTSFNLPRLAASGATRRVFRATKLPEHVVLSPNGKILHDSNWGPQSGSPTSWANTAIHRIQDLPQAAVTQIAQNYVGQWPV
jgi:hypothetical protein